MAKSKKLYICYACKDGLHHLCACDLNPKHVCTCDVTWHMEVRGTKIIRFKGTVRQESEE
jgi:hypothetical protein